MSSTLDTMNAAGEMKPVRPRALVKPLVILVAAIAVIMGGIYGWQLFVGKMINKTMHGLANAPQTVSTTVARTSTWQSHIQALGTARAMRGADLSAQASGVVDNIHFESGSEVAAGAVLLTLKPNDDPAKLAQLQAQADLAALTLKRDQEQLAAQAISQSTVDSDVAGLKSYRAQVAQQEALIQEKTVRAPFAGALGLRQVDEGQYLSAGTTVVTLQALDPIYVDFYLPQQALNQLKVGQAVAATVDAYSGVAFTGRLIAISSKVDSTSRNVQARASFANPERKLLPGMYANVLIESGESSTPITLPQTAITYNPYGDTVYLIQKQRGDQDQESLTVKQTFVKLGETRGDQVAVLSGVAAGDEIVTAGQMKLRNGVSVNVNNQVRPKDNPNPTPPNE